MTQLVQPLAWDSEFWGANAARVHASDVADLHVAESECLEQGIRWASLLVPTDDLDLLNAATSAGYRVVDVRYTMTSTVGPRSAFDSQAIGRPDEAPELASIAGTSLRSSRFFSDHHLDDTRCAAFYETWVHNSFTGQMADVVVVSRSNDAIDGFITVRLDGDLASLPLVAVRHDRQGQGVGRRLLSATLDWIGEQGARRAEVVTQLTNTPAIRLYESGGFHLDQSAFWLHRWFPVSG